MKHNIQMAVAYADDLNYYLRGSSDLEEEEDEESLIDYHRIYDINRILLDNPYGLMFRRNAKFRIVSFRVHKGLNDEKKIYLMEQIDKPDKRFEITDVLLDKYFK